MAFAGGQIPLIGVGLGGLTGVNGGGSGVGGGGFGRPLVNNAINTAVNVGLSTALGDSISQSIGLDLTAGQNILKTQVTPFLTTGVTQALNQTVSNSLGGLGPAAPVVSQIFSQATTALGLSFLGGLFGVQGSWNGVSSPTRQWPGAGSEPDANYGSSNFSGGTGGPDVIFSIRPANQGPQLTGSEAFSVSDLSPTTVALNAFTGTPPNITGDAYSPAFLAKAESMGFSSSLSTIDTSGLTLGGNNGFSL